MYSLILRGRRLIEFQKWGHLRFASPNVLSTLSNSFSSASPADGPKRNNFTVAYLVDSLGFTTKLAESILRKVTSEAKGDPDSVLNLLKSHGFRDSHISTIISNYPRLLLLDAEKSLAPNLKFLHSRGASTSELTEILSKVPKILGMKGDKAVGRYYDFVKDIIEADKSSNYEMSCLSALPEGSRQENIIRNVLVLRRLGVPQKLLFSLLISCSHIVSGKERFEESLKKVVGMGFDPRTSKFVEALRIVYQMSDKTVEDKVNLYKRLGFAVEDVWEMFKKYPFLLAISEKNILNSFETFMRLAFTRDEFVRMVKHCPQCIGLSSELVTKKTEFLVGNICPNIRVADCGHKIGLNGVDNGRIWFDNLRIPRENLLNSVADVSPDGEYVSAIKDPDQRFGAFMAPLTSGRVTIASSAIYSAKVGLAIALRYSLSRRAFSVKANGPEVLLLDYPSHQRRLLPLLAKTYAMSFAANDLKMIYVKRTPETNKAIHVVSSGLKAVLTWHNMHTLQECREAVGGQGVKTENLVGQLKGEFDVQTTFEGDNNVLMQQVSKALFAEYVSCKKRNKPFRGLGLEHMNSSRPVLPTQLSSSTLRCSQFQKNVFCLRERDLLERFTSEVAQLQGRGESRESSFLVNHELAEDLGKAFTEKAILQTILDAEAKLPAGSMKDVLGLVRSMYALISIEEDPSFLRYGYLSRDNVGDDNFCFQFLVSALNEVEQCILYGWFNKRRRG